VGSLLLQKPTAEAFTVTTEMSFVPTQAGQRAGLLVFGSDYAWLGIVRRGGKTWLVLKRCLAADEGAAEETLAEREAPDGALRLRLDWRDGAECQFSFATTTGDFVAFGPAFVARPGRWIGAKVGLFASAAPDDTTHAAADFGWFRVTPLLR
jgi:beta-xylosidase